MNGLVETYPDGRKAGIPYDTWQTFLANRQKYIDLGKDFPRQYTQEADETGAVWEYLFSFENPFYPISRRMVQVPLVTPSGILLDPGGDLTPSELLIPESTIPPYLVPYTVTELNEPTTTTTTPTTPTTTTTTTTPGGINSLWGMAAIGLAMIFGKSRRKHK